MKDDWVYLLHIRECIGHIRKFTAGGREEFLRDRKTQDAVLRNLQTLAESATRLSAPLRERHPEVNWRGIAGFRNVLVHDYLGTNLERIWTIVERDLPVLSAAIDAVVAEQPEGPGSTTQRKT